MLQEEQLQTSEREKQSAQQQLTTKVNVLLSFALAHHSLILQEAELTRKESELLRAEKTIRREQQQSQKMRQRVSLVCVLV